MNGFKIDGYVDIELIDSKTGEIKHKSREHNEIMPVGLKSFAASCLAPYLQNSAIITGNRAINPVGFSHGANTSYPYVYNKNNSGLISPLLLNIDPTNGVKTSGSFVDYLGDDLFIDPNKLIGYGLNNLTPTSDAKEGTIEFPNETTLLDDYTLAIRFKYPEGIATGEINAVSMVPIYDTTRNATLYTTKNLMKVATNATPTPATGSYAMPAFCGGLDDELYIDYTSEGLKGYSYNFTTGEIVSKEITGKGITLSYLSTDSNFYIDVANGYVYKVSTSGQYVYLYVYSLETGASVKSITLNSCNYCYADILNVNSELYLVIVGNFANSTSTTELTTKVYKLTMGTGGYATGYDSTVLTLSSLGISVPEGAHYLIGSRRSDISEFEVKGLKFNAYNTSPLYTSSYAFTSLSNIKGSIIGVRGSNYFGSGLPISKSNLKARLYSNALSFYNNRLVANNTSTTGATVNLNYNNLEFVSESGNALSVYLLSTPVTKGENDILHVTYGYKVSTS